MSKLLQAGEFVPLQQTQAARLVITRLSVMMFLEFFIWGSWFVTLGTFLGSSFKASGVQIGTAFSTQSWGAIVAPFVVGLIADRYFNAERILGVLHLLGAYLMYRLYTAADFSAFYPYVLAYMIVYMPTLALVNSVAFRHLSNATKQFGRIRVWGTVGWIVAGLFISYIGWDAQQAVSADGLRNTFLLCAITSVVMGVYSFTLPSTPPTVKATARTNLGDVIGVQSLRLLKDRNFAVFFAASVLICIPLAFYYQNASPFLTELGVTHATAKLSIGQMSEVGFMLLLPLLLGRVGIKYTLLLGMSAWILRYLLFAVGASSATPWLLIAGIALHGVCYDFFFVTGQIYTDSKAGADYKSAAQGMITLATYGAGMLVGFWVAGRISDAFVVDSKHDWFGIWLVPAGFAALVFIFFRLSFKSERLAHERA